MDLKTVSLMIGLVILGSLGTLYLLKPLHHSNFQLGGLNTHLDTAPEEFSHRVDLFKAWTNQYNKQYSAIEAALRFCAWNKNYEFVQEHNSKNLSWTVEMNQFADLSSEEFAALYLGLNTDESQHGEERNEEIENVEDTELPEAAEIIDWRINGAVNPIRNQGQCGACYAFASAAGLEGMYKIKGGPLIVLSPQQIAACSNTFGNKGCNGGLMTSSYDYTRKFGIETEADYPWTGNMASCNYNTAKVVLKNAGYTNVGASYTSLKDAVKSQPVPVAVQANEASFQFYKSGVLESGCGTNLNHAITAIGYNYSGDLTTSYWIVKNQWGTSWGELGYINIRMGAQNNGAGVCGINKQATYPK